MLCCLAVQLQALIGLCIGVTTNSPDTRPLPRRWGDIDNSDQYWHIYIGSGDCVAYHKGQERVLQWDLDCSAGNTFGCDVSDTGLLQTGELHLYHNGRGVGVVWEGIPTDQLLWGFVDLSGGWKVEANYIIANGEAVCGVNICARYSRTLHFTWLLCESDRYSYCVHSTVVGCSENVCHRMLSLLELGLPRCVDMQLYTHVAWHSRVST